MLKVRALQLAVSVATIAISTGAFVDASFAAKAKSINATGSQATADAYGHTNTWGGSISANAAKSKSTGAGGKANASSGGLYGGYAKNEAANETSGSTGNCEVPVGTASLSPEGGTSASDSRTALTFGASGSSASASSGKKGGNGGGSGKSSESGKKNK